MRSRALVALYVVAMIVAVVAVDVLFLRHDLWPRLAANIAIVAVFLLGYRRFSRR